MTGARNWCYFCPPGSREFPRKDLPMMRSNKQDGSSFARPVAGGETHQTASAADAALTTNQGLAVSDNQNSAQERRPRPDSSRRFHSPGKDHPFRPRANSRSASSTPGAPALMVSFRSMSRKAGSTRAAFSSGPRQEDPRVRALFDGGRGRRIVRSGARRARLRGEILYPGRQLRPGRQQHSGVLHSGRHQVSRPHSRGEARA